MEAHITNRKELAIVESDDDVDSMFEGAMSGLERLTIIGELMDALTHFDMDKPVTVGAFPGYTVRDAMAEMLEHQKHHLDDLRAALHAHPER